MLYKLGTTTHVLLAGSLAITLGSLVAGSQTTRREVTGEVGSAAAGLANTRTAAAEDHVAAKAEGLAVRLAEVGGGILSGDEGGKGNSGESEGLHCDVMDDLKIVEMVKLEGKLVKEVRTDDEKSEREKILDD